MTLMENWSVREKKEKRKMLFNQIRYWLKCDSGTGFQTHSSSFSGLLSFVKKATRCGHWGRIKAAVCPSSRLLRPHTGHFGLHTIQSSAHKQPTQTAIKPPTLGHRRWQGSRDATQQCASCEFASRCTGLLGVSPACLPSASCPH